MISAKKIYYCISPYIIIVMYVQRSIQEENFRGELYREVSINFQKFEQQVYTLHISANQMSSMTSCY